MTDVAQAATWVITGPVRPYSIDSMQAPIEPDSAGIANGLTKRGPVCRARGVPSMTCSIPPPPVLTTTPTRSRCVLVHRPEVDARVGDRLLAGGHREVDEPAHPARHLRIHGLAGSKSLTSAAIRTSNADASKL